MHLPIHSFASIHPSIKYPSIRSSIHASTHASIYPSSHQSHITLGHSLEPPRPSRPKVIVTNSQAEPKTSFHVELFTVSNRFGELRLDSVYT